MSLVLISRALEKKLAALTPALPIAAENGTFTPTTGQPYQAISLLPAATFTRDLDERVVEERGVFQIMICYPSGQGPVSARTRAELIRQHFAPGPLPTESGVTTEILGKPSIAAAVPATGWYCIPVRVTYKAVIQS